MTDNTDTQNNLRQDNLFKPSQAERNAEAGNEGEKIDISALFRTIKKEWRWPLALAVVGILIAIIITLFTVPVFKSSGSIYLGNAEKDQAAISSATVGLSLVPGLSQAPNLETQVQIMQSRQVIERAIVRSGTNVSILSPGQNEVVDYWYWLFSGHSFGIYKNDKIGLHGDLAEAINPGIYGTPLRLVFGENGHYKVYKNKVQVLDGIIGEPAVSPLMRIIIKPNKNGFSPKKNSEYSLKIKSPFSVYKEFASNIMVSQSSKDTGGSPTLSYLIDLSFKNSNPYVSQKFLNGLMLSYLEQTHAWATGQASSTYDYLNEQLEKVRAALETADSNLAGYQSHSGVLSVSSNAQAMITQMAEFESQKSALQLKLDNLHRLRTELTSKNGGHVNPYLVSSVGDTVLNGLSDKLITAQNKEASLRELYTPQAPEMKQASTEISSIKNAIVSVIGNQDSDAQQQLNTLNELISKFKEKMGRYPKEALQVLSLTRSSEVLGKLYMFLLEKQEEAAISKASNITKNRVLDPALVQGAPVAPLGSKNILIGGFLGLLVGLGIVFAKFIMHKGFHSDEEILRRYAANPLFGALPEYGKFEQSGKNMKGVSLHMPDPRSGYGEAMRLLRGKLYLDKKSADGGEIVMFSSAGQGDGKTMVATQLATTLANDGRQVLLIDADLRNPQLHITFGLPQVPGLSNLLTGKTKPDECLHKITNITEISTLTVLTAGEIHSSPVELVGKKDFAQLLEKWRLDYEFILLDTPPFPMVSDGLMISRLVDRVLSIVRVGKTSRLSFQEHMNAINQTACPNGLVINGTLSEQGLGYRYDPEETNIKKWMERINNIRSRFARKI